MGTITTTQITEAEAVVDELEGVLKDIERLSDLLPLADYSNWVLAIDKAIELIKRKEQRHE